MPQIMRLAQLVIFLALACSIYCATYYVSPSGDDLNDGSLASPWKSPGKLNIMQPGDTGYFRGGVYDNSVYIHGANNPNADFSKPVTLAAYPGEVPIISGPPTYGVFFNLFDSSFVLDGIRFEHCVPNGIWVVLSGAHNSTVKNTYFGECDDTGIQVRTCNNVVIRNNTFYKSGNALDQGESDNMYVLGSTHVLIEYNHFSYGAHAAVDVIEFDTSYSSHIIMQHNVVESHWGGGFYVHRGTTHTVIQDNVFLYAGEGTTYPKTGVQIAQEKAIVRRNVIAKADATDAADHCFVLNAFVFYSRNLSCVHNRVYNNVMFECGYYALKVNQKDYAVISDNVFVNNIMYRSKTGGDYEEYSTYGNYTIGFETYHAYPELKWGDENFATDRTYFEANIILNADATTDKPGDISVYWLETAEHRWNLSTVSNLYPGVFKNNYEFNPGFVDEANMDLHLRPDSKSIDAGVHLTKTTSSGSATTTIPVADAYYFIDGYGMIDGDMIKVGDNDAVMVTNVDFDTKILTVATPISFASGDFVSLDFSGAAPDLGAFEYYVPPAPKASNNSPSGSASPSTPGSVTPSGQRVSAATRLGSVGFTLICLCAAILI